MKKLFYSILMLICIPAAIFSQDENALNLAAKIKTSQLQEIIETIASDEYQGRKTGTEGETKTANYLVDYFTKLKIKKAPSNSYLQEIPVVKSVNVEKYFMADGKNCSSDYSYYNSFGQKTLISDSSFVFIGYGTSSFGYDDLYGLDLSNKIVLMMNGSPMNKYGMEYASGSNKMEQIKKTGPQAILTVEFDKFSDYYSSRSGSENVYYDYSYNREIEIPSISITERLANWMIRSTNKSIKQIRYEIEETGESLSSVIKQPISIKGGYEITKYGSSNIIGVIEGSSLKDEYIVLMAHYDHEGRSYKDEIYNGADDNASGVSALLEIARILSEAKKEGKGPKRSIIFLLTTAEEMGLYGSSFYTENPLFPIEKTKACINLDMIGRIDKSHSEKDANYVYVIASEKGNDPLVKKTVEINNNSLKLELNTSDPDNLFSRSDHYNFFRKNVPSIFFTSGVHDDYHQPTDDPEKINFDLLKSRAQLSFLLLWELANQETPQTISISAN